MLFDLVQKTVLGQQCQGGKSTNGTGKNGQEDVPGIVLHFSPSTQVFKTVRGQTAQREPLKVRPAREKHEQQNGKQKAGNGVGGDDGATGPCVKTGSVVYSFADTKRDRYDVSDQGRPKAKGDRNGQFFLNQFDHGNGAEITLSKIKAQVVFDHVEKAFNGGLVKAELFFKLFDELGRQATGACILTVCAGI